MGASGLAPQAWAAGADPRKVALVIGNGAYGGSPLANPVHDAAAMADLLTRAQFTVTKLTDANLVSMQSAIERFVADVKRNGAHWAFFYYAGHGAQLEWRNYLLPVDAGVDNADQLRQSCIDLNQVIGRFEAGKGTSFVIVLDACRNNPFGERYVPAQKGLSQFDAPAGSLLAYATSPGNVAADGAGQNGLYTGNLVRELAVPGVRLEDALKRVRLNVRLESRGAQVPWETTSLEDDLVLFGDKAVAEGDQPRVLESERKDWALLAPSLDPQDWIAYLRAHPSGRFAEAAQVRLVQLLAQREATAAGAQASGATSIELGAGLPVPALIQPSKNPYSAGLFRLARHFTVGDRAAYRTSNLISDAVDRKQLVLNVTDVDEHTGRVEINSGEAQMDLAGNFLQPPGSPVSDVPQQLCPAELHIGKSWKAGWKQFNARWGDEYVTLTLRVAALERVVVPAGEFETFRIDVQGWHAVSRGSARHEQKIWLIPGLNFIVKSELKVAHPQVILNADRIELVSLRQKTFDLQCSAGQRNLAVGNSCT